MSRTRENSNCAVCRLPFPVAAVVKLWVEHEESQSNPAPPLMDSQKEEGRAFIEVCGSVGENAREEELLQTIVNAEKLLMGLEETHGDTEAEKLLKLLSVSVGDLRKRLKLFSRINNLQQEKASLELERDSLRQAVIDQLKEADGAADIQSKLARRLKRTSSELEEYRARKRGEQEATSSTVQDLKAQLRAERTRSAKYQKRYYATLQNLKGIQGKRKSGDGASVATSESELSDNSLEIIPAPGSEGCSDSALKKRLRGETTSSKKGLDCESKGRRKVGSTGLQRAGPSRKKLKSTEARTLSSVAEGDDM